MKSSQIHRVIAKPFLSIWGPRRVFVKKGRKSRDTGPLRQFSLLGIEALVSDTNTF